MRPVSRPDRSLPGTSISEQEYSPPADTVQLWQAFNALSRESREQFVRAGRAWQVALSLSSEHPTASAAFMVVACEALKPVEKRFDRHNIYHVVEALLGKPTADRLRSQRFQPQQMRSRHFHRGELAGSELAPLLMMSTFTDPSFDEAHRFLANVTPAAIIEWLRANGKVSLSKSVAPKAARQTNARTRRK